MQWIDVPSAGEGASAIWERLLLIPLPVIIFWIIYTIYNSIKNEQKKGQYKEATTKICSDCLGNIPKLAKKCMHCGTPQKTLKVEKQIAIIQTKTMSDKVTFGPLKGLFYGILTGLFLTLLITLYYNIFD